MTSVFSTISRSTDDTSSIGFQNRQNSAAVNLAVGNVFFGITSNAAMVFRGLNIPRAAHIQSATLTMVATANRLGTQNANIALALPDGKWDPLNRTGWSRQIFGDMKLNVNDVSDVSQQDTRDASSQFWELRRDSSPARHQQLGQRITLEQSFQLGSVDMDLRRIGNPSGDLFLEIYAADLTPGPLEGSPTGAPLATSLALPANTVPTGSTAIRFDFSGVNRIELLQNQSIVIVLRGTFRANATDFIQAEIGSGFIITPEDEGEMWHFGTGEGVDFQNYPAGADLAVEVWSPAINNGPLVPWDIGVTVPGTQLVSPDISALIQKSASSIDYVANDPMFLIVQGGSSGNRQLAAWDNLSFAEPRLDVTYVPGPVMESEVVGFSDIRAPSLQRTPLAMSALVSGSGSLDANLRTFDNINAQMDGTSTLEAARLEALLNVDGSVDGQSDIAGNMLLSENDITADIEGVSSLQANMNLTPMVLIPFPIVGSGDLSGTLSFPQLSLAPGSIEATSELQADIAVARAIQGQVDGNSSLDAMVGLILAVQGALGSTGGFEGLLAEIVQMQASLDGVSTFQGTMVETEAIDGGNIDGQSALSGSLRLLPSVQGQIDAVSAFVATTLNRLPLALSGQIIQGTSIFVAPSVLPIITVPPGGVDVPNNPTGEVGSPASGGYLAVFTGSGFRLPPDPPPGFVGGTYPRTMRVEFNGEPSPDVRVLTEELMTAVVPPYRGNADVSPIPPSDIRIVALDPETGGELSGVGDVLVLPEVFQYRRPKFGASTNLKRGVRELLRTIKRQFHPNVSMTVDIDYDDTVDDMLDQIKLSELPSVIVQGPDLTNNRFYSVNERQYLQDGRKFSAPQVPRTVDLTFTLVGAADKTAVMLDMLGEIERFFELNKFFEMDRDPDDPGAGVCRFEMDVTADFSVRTRANRSNVRHFEGSFVIRGFDIELPVEQESFELDADDGCVTLEIEPL